MQKYTIHPTLPTLFCIIMQNNPYIQPLYVSSPPFLPMNQLTKGS
nr:MAG TPA: hypothetical protein [Caudoviricetes sp.]